MTLREDMPTSVNKNLGTLVEFERIVDAALVKAELKSSGRTVADAFEEGDLDLGGRIRARLVEWGVIAKHIF